MNSPLCYSAHLDRFLVKIFKMIKRAAVFEALIVFFSNEGINISTLYSL